MVTSGMLSIDKKALPEDKRFIETATNVFRAGECKVYLTTTNVCKDSYAGRCKTPSRFNDWANVSEITEEIDFFL